MSEIEYSRFAQYYLEIADHLNNLERKAEELLSEGEVVPQNLSNEIFRHTVIIEILTQAGKELYNKATKQLYSDGLQLWFIENAELQEIKDGANK